MPKSVRFDESDNGIGEGASRYGPDPPVGYVLRDVQNSVREGVIRADVKSVQHISCNLLDVLMQQEQ
jgi:hypothetical protein